jgi:molybdenum cofactor cytidylyltransferase
VRPGAIILAAGESSRMGRPKALLPFRGGTFLSVLAATLASRCSPVIAVFGAGAENLVSNTPPAVSPVINSQYRLGMLTSLQAGLRVLPVESRGRVLFGLVDHPAVVLGTIDALVHSPADIAIPRCAGKRGHPVALRKSIIDELLAEPPDSRIHDVIDRHSGEIEYIEVNDPGIRDDVDDPAAYERLMLREAEPA